MLSSNGGGMSVLIHRNVAMESFVGMRRFKGEDEEAEGEEEERHIVKHQRQEEDDEDDGSETSSIGVDEESSLSLTSSSLGADDDEALSDLRETEVEDEEDDTFASVDDLDDSLPNKRGLSNYFSGKAKSFSSLADVITNPTTASDLAKQEHPFNKRRRILLAAKKRAAWPRRASCGSLVMLPHPPVIASELRVLEEVDEEEDRDSSLGGESPRLLPPLPSVGHGRSLKPTRSFSLTNLQQHDEIS